MEALTIVPRQSPTPAIVGALLFEHFTFTNEEGPVCELIPQILS